MDIRKMNINRLMYVTQTDIRYMDIRKINKKQIDKRYMDIKQSDNRFKICALNE